MRTMTIVARALALAFVFALAGQGVALAKDSVPTHITSDSLRYDMTARTVTFEGGVLVDRPDLRINAELIVVRFAKSKDNTSAKPAEGDFDPGNIETIEASKAVVIHFQGRVGKCAKAVFNVPSGVLSMEGQPEIIDGPNHLQGETIRFDFRNNRSEVVGGKRRVEATFSTPKGLEVPSAQ